MSRRACFSIDRRSTSAGDGLAPSRLRRESACANGAFIVTTGYSSATKSGRALTHRVARRSALPAASNMWPRTPPGGRRPMRRTGRCDRLGRRTRRRAIAPGESRAARPAAAPGWPYSDNRYFSTNTVTPSGDQLANELPHLVVHREPRVAAAGTDDHRRAVGRAGRRIVRERRVVDVDTRPSTTRSGPASGLRPGTPSARARCPVPERSGIAPAPTPSG